MEAFYSAVVDDEHGRHLFYVGEFDEAAAEQTFLRAKPQFQGTAVTYERVDGAEGAGLDMKPGMVKPWLAGAGVIVDVQGNRFMG